MERASAGSASYYLGSETRGTDGREGPGWRQGRARRWGWPYGVVYAITLLLPAPLLARQFPTDSAIKRVMREWVESGKSPGLVVGLLDENGTRVLTHGTSGVPGLPLDGKTIFEIGSITKTFTTALLAEMVARGEVRLDQPVAELLPDTVRVPAWNGRQITLRDLATHTSGLPRNPTNMSPRDTADPYADYSVQDLYRFLSNYELKRAPGARVEYSNLGMGLLGLALALKAGKSYEQLLIERILTPLRMTDTRVNPTRAQEARRARGHTETGEPTPHWHFLSLPGAGALNSNAEDLFRYLSANLGDTGGSLIPILASTHETQVNANDTLAIGLGWLIDRTRPSHPLWWHNGGTGGFRSFVGFDPSTKRGVVVLSNADNSVNDIGFWLLRRGEFKGSTASETDDAALGLVTDCRLLPRWDSLLVKQAEGMGTRGAGMALCDRERG